MTTPDTAAKPDYTVTLVLPDVCEPADYESTPTPEDAVQAFIGAVQGQSSLYVYEVYDFTTKRTWHIDLAEGTTEEAPRKLGLIGRDYVLIEKLAEQIRTAMRREYDYTDLHETADRRGQWFEVRTVDGYIARISVVLDRIEQTDGT